jgi:regulator of replication initiation timing
MMNLIQGAKWLVKKMPAINALVKHRDVLLEQHGILCLERDQVRQKLAEVEKDLAQKQHEIDALCGGEKQGELDSLRREKEELLIKFGEVPFVPNGHFYSPIAAREELMRDAQRIFSTWPKTLYGIDLREGAQLEVVREIASYYDSLPFQEERVDGLRYRYNNDAFGYADAIFLNGMIRHVRPKRIIEIGSGNSSAMTLDTNERWFNNSIECTFIDPYPAVLHSLLKPADRERVTIHPDRVQDVPLDVYDKLESGDILFIDSTHVSKIGSDVNHILFEVLPKIASGVYIHFHDIFYPFEYPRWWAEKGISWNELYMLRAFLQNNDSYEIVLFNNYIVHFHREYFEAHMPLCARNSGGSIWLRKC